LTSTLSSTAGIDADNNVQFVLPQGINLFNFSGGAQFVHGGMSLQETVIPAVSATQIKQKVKTRPVSIQVLGTSHRITTNRHRFELLQTEAVSDDLRPITVKIAVFDEQKPVTNIETVTFDSSSNKINDRKKSVTLLLQNAKFDKNKTYRLVLREVEKDKEIYSVGVIIDRAFADDFN
jgi:hypothetical protein